MPRIERPRKVAITAAGLGTRLLPMTKELPKEMLPIYMRSQGRLILKPLLQALFEQLFAFGMRDFCFIVGREKRAIEDHFTPDKMFVENLKANGKPAANDLVSFYKMIDLSSIQWINQPEARGFGAAVSLARSFVGKEPFLLTAGDTLILSNATSYLTRMMNVFANSDATAVILLQEMLDPRAYGVVSSFSRSGDAMRLNDAQEKPERPKSNLAIIPFYIFTPRIFDAIEHINSGKGGEIQLTDAIQRLIKKGDEVLGVKLLKDELRLDIGTPETYWEAQTTSYKRSVKSRDKTK
jgi:UTP--glucose-1-phosphate uridylyltransferase